MFAQYRPRSGAPGNRPPMPTIAMRGSTAIRSLSEPRFYFCVVCGGAVNEFAPAAVTPCPIGMHFVYGSIRVRSGGDFQAVVTELTGQRRLAHELPLLDPRH